MFTVDTGAAFPTFAETKAALGSRSRRLCTSNDDDAAAAAAGRFERLAIDDEFSHSTSTVRRQNPKP